MSENDIKKAADFCCNDKTTCIGCPLNDCEYKCGVYLSKYIKENEPAPAEAETSSKENNLHFDDNTSRRICQAFVQTQSAAAHILEIYEGMSESEQRAFDLGEAYNEMCGAIEELEDIKGGESS